MSTGGDGDVRMNGTEIVWLLRSEAAAYLRLSVSSLAHMACNGMGPRYFKTGNRARYLKADLDAWARSVAYEPLSLELQRYVATRGGMRGIRRSFKADL
ncbi:hypothetical protein DF3PB_10041 [uncultured Defluviicoccus sp.]|uniref:Helix-turn-helix domain-containing protein n=1 Tax=metagenome TaxID=256318 RepID=A0A380T7E0_9ZZZZ|nr:hypothetical protein DF3PB_10041 [uncultured Defluviicoccus sp.]